MQLICHLGEHSAIRVLRSDTDLLSVETASRRRDRIATISLPSGVVNFSSTKRPIINRLTGSSSGSRWITARNSRSDGGKSASIQWQDDEHDGTYYYKVTGEECVGSLCPLASRVAFIATRKSSTVGDGAVYALSRGKLLWSFRPHEITDYPHWKGLPQTTLLRAYPYRMVSPPDASFLAFSFLNHLYLLDANGNLINQWATATLLTESFGDQEFDVSSTRDSREVIEVPGFGSIELTTSISIFPAFEQPVVDAMEPLEGGDAFIVSSRNGVIWIARSGSVAHSILFDHSYPLAPGNCGSVSKIVASRDGRQVLTEIDRKALWSIREGRIAHERDYASENFIWAANRKCDAIAVQTRKCRTISVLDDCLCELDAVLPGFAAREMSISDDGRFLFVSGGNNPIYRL